MNQGRARRQWSYRKWLASQSVSPHTLRLRHALAWALVAALWLDFGVTAIALEFRYQVHELNPVGLALYASFGLLGLAGLKAWSSLIVLAASHWVRPLRAVKVLTAILVLYVCILVWNGIQLARVL